MDFYFIKRSTPSQRALFALAEVGCAFTPHLLDPRSGETRSAAYRAVNPMGKVPSLVDGALSLWESTAIAWYLAEKFPERGLFPETLEGRADAMRWVAFFGGHFGPASTAYYMNTVGPRFYGNVPDEKLLEKAKAELARFLPVLDERLSRGAWLLGERLSVADVVYAPNLAVLGMCGYDLAPWPKAAAWAGALLARPAWKRAAELSPFEP